VLPALRSQCINSRRTRFGSPNTLRNKDIAVVDDKSKRAPQHANLINLISLDPIEAARKTAAAGEAVYGSIAPVAVDRCRFRGTGWPVSAETMSRMNGPSGTTRIVIVDDNDLFRESLGLNLIDEGYQVTSLPGGQAALDHFAEGGTADVVLLDWRMPGINGLEVLRRLRRAGNTTPVIFLTVLSEDIYEEAALEGGAVDFIDKSRRLPILIKRLQLIVEGARHAPTSGIRPPGDVLHIGRLELRFDINRARWSGAPIDLTLTEFKIIALLALRAGEDVSYREIFDMVHGKDFAAGYGDEGYRANVRTSIKRIRKKLHDVEPEFEHIQNYAGFGYRWTGD
jgi:two-component system, OmpR family, response regulator ChvI